MLNFMLNNLICFISIPLFISIVLYLKIRYNKQIKVILNASKTAIEKLEEKEKNKEEDKKDLNLNTDTIDKLLEKARKKKAFLDVRNKEYDNLITYLIMKKQTLQKLENGNKNITCENKIEEFLLN